MAPVKKIIADTLVFCHKRTIINKRNHPLAKHRKAKTFMKKMNYRITVNIQEQTMNLGFRGPLPSEMEGKKIRVQAVFSQRQVDRRFPMETVIEEDEELGAFVRADAEILLPWVFAQPPRHKVSVTFAVWCGMEEIILDDQPFPVQKELFARTERLIKRNAARFALGTAALPVLLARGYLKEGKNMSRAKKWANETVYRFSGCSYSPRQRNTDYFADCYEKYKEKMPELTGNKVLFLSERLPEQGGNLALIKAYLEAEPEVEVTEFICTRTVNALRKSELRECAKKCAQARVIILEDFYPQLHSLKLRKETKVVQLWHACGAFKTFGLTRMGKPGGAPQSSMNHRNYDFVSVSGEAIRGIYAEAFAIPTGKVKALGVPRTDCLFDNHYKEKVKKDLLEKYPVLSGKKVVLFAPTFRGDGNRDAFYPPEAFDVNRFMEAMPENVVCIVKHHPFVHQTISVRDCFADRVLDLTGKDHINDLMLLTDLLITDYSSSIFEAAILEVPMLFYAFDQEEYMESRDFYFDYESMTPGPVEHSFEGVLQRTGEILFAGEQEGPCNLQLAKKTERFRAFFLDALDGKSTERVGRFIMEHYLDAPEKE